MRTRRMRLVLGLVVGLALFAGRAFSAEQGAGKVFVADRILVKFKAGTDAATRDAVHRAHGAAGIGEVRALGYHLVKIPAGQVQAMVAAYRGEKNVEVAEPDYIAHAVLVPNDPSFTSQWGMTKIQAPQAWDVTTGAASVKVAILDTGICQNHADLAKIVANQNFSGTASVDDLYGHGTHCAGIAAAITNNGVGVAGVGFNSSLMNVKVLDDTGSGSYSGIANGITWAADNGAKVISMSFGGSAGSSTLQSAVNYAWNKGVVLVAAAGNGGNSNPLYPAYYSNCISVAATDSNDAIASWSSYGTWVTVAAPGVNIYSTEPPQPYAIGGSLNYGYLSGTSMACPHVAGLAALIWSTPYGTTNVNVRGRIQSTADAITGTGTKWIYGRVNAYKAVAVDTTAPAQVAGLSVVTASSSQLNLHWTANAEPDVKNYNVYRSLSSGGPYSLIASPTTNSYSNTGLSASTTCYYVVSAMDQAGSEGAVSAEASGATSAATSSIMHIANIRVALRTSGANTSATATVTIVNAAGGPVAGATVSGRWSGATSDSDTGATDSTGNATLPSSTVKKARSGTTFTFTVTNVVLAGWTYDPTSNVLTSNSIKVP